MLFAQPVGFFGSSYSHILARVWLRQTRWFFGPQALFNTSVKIAVFSTTHQPPETFGVLTPATLIPETFVFLVHFEKIIYRSFCLFFLRREKLKKRNRAYKICTTMTSSRPKEVRSTPPSNPPEPKPTSDSPRDRSPTRKVFFKTGASLNKVVVKTRLNADSQKGQEDCRFMAIFIGGEDGNFFIQFPSVVAGVSSWLTLVPES